MDALVIARHLYGSEYLKRFLSHGVRPDGRTPGQCRPVAVSGGDTERGSPVVARMGGTMVSCGIRPVGLQPAAVAGTGHSHSQQTRRGILGDANFQRKPKSVRRQKRFQMWTSLPCVTLVIDQDLLPIEPRVPVVKTTELCIVKMKLCWCLFIDVVCLSDDGCLFDAVVLAVMVALRKLLLPKVEVQEQAATPVVQSAHSQPLPINCLVTAATVASVDQHILLDPTSEESLLIPATVTVLTDAKGALCGVHKQGEAVDSKHLIRCIKESAKRCNDIHELLKSIAEPTSELTMES